MDTQTKEQIIKAAQEYVKSNNITQEDLSNVSGVSTAYINSILNGKTTHNANGKNTPISNNIFKKIAKAINYNNEVQYWNTLQTKQYMQIYVSLHKAKEQGNSIMLIGETGCGKTYTVDEFCKEYPKGTYKITVSTITTISDIIDEICLKLKLSLVGSKGYKLRRITEKFEAMKLDGINPLLIFDESENMKVATLNLVKAFYDKLVDYCPIVLVGTNQLLTKLEKLKERDKSGVPQFCRRFKAGTLTLENINKENMLSHIIDLIDSDEDLLKILKELCDNYGELHDYLEPALREAAERGEKLTVELFCKKYGLTHYLKSIKRGKK